MTTTRIVSRAAIIILWALALWNSWACRGLFVDGANQLIDVIIQRRVVPFREARFWAEIAGQAFAVLGIHAGIKDLHRLSQLYSLGLFALPTGFYHLALRRARDEPVLLAATLAVIATVYMTTSFFIVGEYNSTFAVTTASAVWLATTTRLRVVEGLAFALIALFFSRTYEVTLYHGPILALMTLWRIKNVAKRPLVASILYLIAAAFFLGGGIVALESVIAPFDPEHLKETYDTALNFWQNPQFDVIFAAVLVVVVWALVRPADLAGRRPYLWGMVLLAILALSPLMALTDTVVRPLARSQYVARTGCGLVVIAVVLFIWFYSSEFRGLLRATVMLRRSDVAQNFLGFAWFMLLATIPSDIFLTATWIDYLDTLRVTVTSRTGVVAIEDTPLAHRPANLMVEDWALTSQSLVVRSKTGDALIAPRREFKDWVPFPPERAPDLGQYLWRR